MSDSPEPKPKHGIIFTSANTYDKNTYHPGDKLEYNVDADGYLYILRGNEKIRIALHDTETFIKQKTKYANRGKKPW